MALENVITTLVLDVIDHDQTQGVVKAIALDSKTRYVQATIVQHGIDYDVDPNATVTLTILRPDNVGVQVTGSVVDVDNADRTGTIKGVYAELTQAALAKSGTLKAQFKMTVGEQILRTEIFQVKNGIALDGETSEWADQYEGYNLDELVQSVNSAVATVEGMESDVSELKSGLNYLFEDEQLINARHIETNNNTAIVNNDDGTYTIGTSDYGNTTFGELTTLTPGDYYLFGVPNGIAYLSTVNTASQSYANRVFENTSDVPKKIHIDTEQQLWVGFRSTSKPTSSYIISPSLYFHKPKVYDALRFMGVLENSIDLNKGFLCLKSVDVASADESGKTDRKNDIQTMLDTYGYCKLGAGAFYIRGQINMPEGSTLEGCGESTKIYLMSGNNKAAIQLRRYGSVKNLCVIGSYTDLTESDFGETSGSRYGIQYYKGKSDTWVSAYCSISNVHIRNFTGGGIYQYGTGANVEQGLFVSNVHIKNCWCGIWIYSNSEFCRYNNVQITYCYIACINNGGNNAFENCVFHAYSIGMKIDGTQNNSAHGMCSNSSFCHSGNNSGSALTLSDIAHGYLFSACQFWYNSVDISACGGIVFSGCEFGRSAPININGGNTVMLGNCVFMNDVTYPPSINITNNTKVKFTGCYGSVSGNEVTE